MELILIETYLLQIKYFDAASKLISYIRTRIWSDFKLTFKTTGSFVKTFKYKKIFLKNVVARRKRNLLATVLACCTK